MLTIPTAAENPLNNCRRLYPSMDSSPFPYVVGKRRSQLLRFYFEYAGEMQGQCPACLWRPPMASFSTEAGLRHLPLADARQNYTSFRYAKKRSSCPFLAQSGHGRGHCTCLLSGVKRTSSGIKRTSII